MRHILAALILTTLPAQAAEAPLRAEDVRRLEDIDVAAGRALLKAFAKGEPDDLATLATALHGEAQNAVPSQLVGDWSCRTYKLGGDLGLVIYPPFKCRITAAENGSVLLEKLTGSQRVRGLVRLEESGAMVLAGVAYIAGDTPPDYGALPEAVDVSATPQILPAIGRIEMTGPNTARILFPFPFIESTLDILQLSR